MLFGSTYDMVSRQRTFIERLRNRGVSDACSRYGRDPIKYLIHPPRRFHECVERYKSVSNGTMLPGILTSRCHRQCFAQPSSSPVKANDTKRVGANEADDDTRTYSCLLRLKPGCTVTKVQHQSGRSAR